MKKFTLVLAIVLLLGGLFSGLYYGVQWHYYSNETMENVERLRGLAEEAAAEGREDEVYSRAESIDRELDYYREKKDLSNYGYIGGGVLIVLSFILFWRWKKME